MQYNNRPKPPRHMVIYNYLSHVVLILAALLNEFLNLICIHKCLIDKNNTNQESYAQQLYDKFEGFYYRNLIWRFVDRLAQPICSVAGERITVMERQFSKFNKTFKLTGRTNDAINFGSYNYLGYAQNSGHITDSVDKTIRQLGVGLCSTATEIGRQQIYCDLEALVAKYLGTKDAIVYGMGFATNAYTMSALFGRGCLVLSDELNHSSIALGCRTSGAHIQVFKHNDMIDLERLVRQSIVCGQPHTGRAWKKIVIIVEGIYSMEGTIVNLPQILRIKKQYKLYVYLDEAHSIGALGSRGRGVCDYYGCDPKDVDILMGTFTKSFAAAGGYMAASERTIAYLRSHTTAFHYATPIAPPVVQQIMSVLTELCFNQNDSHTRLKRLHENTVYFRQKLKQLGYHLDGNDDSPVVPLMVYLESYLKYFLIRLMESGIATIGVAYPVTTLIGVRIRLCVSASHTKEMIDKTIQSIDSIGSQLSLNFDKNS